MLHNLLGENSNHTSQYMSACEFPKEKNIKRKEKIDAWFYRELSSNSTVLAIRLDKWEKASNLSSPKIPAQPVLHYLNPRTGSTAFKLMCI